MAARPMDHGGPAVVPLPAEIDITNAGEVFDRICAALAPGPATVIADLTATTFCDSSGVRHLLLAHRRAGASGTRLRFAVPAASPVRRILAFTGADQVIAVYPTLDEAVSGDPTPAQPGSLEGAAEKSKLRLVTILGEVHGSVGPGRGGGRQTCASPQPFGQRFCRCRGAADWSGHGELHAYGQAGDCHKYRRVVR